MSVEIDVGTRRSQHVLAALGGAPKLCQRLGPPAAVEVVELALQSFVRDHRRPKRDQARPPQTVTAGTPEVRILAQAAIMAPALLLA